MSLSADVIRELKQALYFFDPFISINSKVVNYRDLNSADLKYQHFHSFCSWIWNFKKGKVAKLPKHYEFTSREYLTSMYNGASREMIDRAGVLLVSPIVDIIARYAAY